MTIETQTAESASTTRSPSRPACPVCGTPDPSPWIAAPDRFHGRTRPYQLVRCASCSMVWLEDPPSKWEMGEHYGADYDRTIARAAKAADHWFGRRDELRRLKPEGGAVLDLGCASGGFLSTMQGPGWKLCGIEMSEEAAQVARTRCGAEVFVGDILDAPFAPASFDAITCFNVFEHVYEPGAVLAKVSEWLRPGGVFFTMMPNIDSAGARIFRSYWYALELPRHLYHFSPKTLRRMTQAVGLEEVFLQTQRDLYFEPSTRYLFNEFLKKFGIRRQPMATAPEASFPWKVIRKIFRMTVLRLIVASAGIAGEGEMMYAAFRKSGDSKTVRPPA